MHDNQFWILLTYYNKRYWLLSNFIDLKFQRKLNEIELIVLQYIHFDINYGLVGWCWNIKILLMNIANGLNKVAIPQIWGSLEFQSLPKFEWKPQSFCHVIMFLFRIWSTDIWMTIHYKIKLRNELNFQIFG